MSSNYLLTQVVLGVRTSNSLGELRVSSVLKTEMLRVHNVPEYFKDIHVYRLYLTGNGSSYDVWNAINASQIHAPRPWTE